MASSEYLADELIDSVREEGLLPDADEESTTPKIRRILNREQRLYLMTLLLKAREEYQCDSITVAVVSGTARYALPSRAVAASIRRVERVAASPIPLYPVSQDRLQSLGGSAFGTGDYYLDGNYLVLIETPSSTDTLRVVFARRFNKVVAGEEACVVTDFDADAKTVTLALASDDDVTAPPDAFTATGSYDFIRGTPHFDLLAEDSAATALASNVLTFSSLPGELAVGDFVALAGQSPVANMPLEVQDVLVLKAVHSYLSGGKDGNAANLVKERLAQAEADLLSLISPRVADSPKFFINFSAPGWNRLRWRWRRSQ